MTPSFAPFQCFCCLFSKLKTEKYSPPILLFHLSGVSYIGADMWAAHPKEQTIMAIDDRDIITAIKNCKERGFQLLMAKYMKPIYWHIRRIVVAHADAQDATQETFIRVFRHFGRYDSGTPFPVWIYRIATHEALRIVDRRRHGMLDMEATAKTIHQMEADNYVDYSEVEAVRLQQAILSLPIKQQLAFNLRYYDEMGYDEIASITDSKPANVKSNYHIAKEKIIRYLHTHDS